MPLTYISYMVDASMCRWTGIPLIGEMHIVNVLLHTTNFWLLWKMLSILGSRHGEGVNGLCSGVTLLAAIIWAVHPLRVEPVAWIAARKELLWTLFALSGLICWEKNHRFITLFFCVLACLSKPTAMCFPFLALLVACRNQLRDAFSQDCCAKVVFYFLFFVVASATAAIAAYSQTHVAGQEATSLYAMPFSHRLVNAFSALGFYLRTTFIPAGLHVDCRTVASFWPLDSAENLVALALFAALVIVFLLFNGKTSPSNGKIIFALGWILFSLGPTLGLLGGFGIEAHADRFVYLPSMALSFLIVEFLGRWRGIWKWMLLLAISFATVTAVQLPYWRNDEIAHLRVLACDQDHPRAMVHVADASCSRHHDFDGGISLYRKAIALADMVPEGGFDIDDVTAKLAYALATRGRDEDFSEVKRLGEKVLADMRRDRRGMMLDALGTAFMHTGDRERAVQLFRASIAAPGRFWPTASTRRKLELVEKF